MQMNHLFHFDMWMWISQNCFRSFSVFCIQIPLNFHMLQIEQLHPSLWWATLLIACDPAQSAYEVSTMVWIKNFFFLTSSDKTRVNSHSGKRKELSLHAVSALNAVLAVGLKGVNRQKCSCFHKSAINQN